MANRFNMHDWYWFIGADTTQVYSSKHSSLMDINSVDYISWISSNNYPTTIDSQLSLNDVLNAPILAEIATLELKQLRPMRELSLGDTSASIRISDLNTQIALLRTTLHK